MRITNSIMQRVAVEGLQRNLRKVVEAQEEAATGLRVRAMSDDPNAASEVMRASASLRAVEQYKRNISSADTRLSLEESVLNQVTDTLNRAKELGLAEGQSSGSSQTRQIAKQEVDELRKFLMGLGNTQHEGEYLFGGVTSNVAPFSSLGAPYSAAPPTGTRSVEASAGSLVRENHNGTEVFLNTNVMAALDQLSTALGNDDVAGIQSSLSTIDQAHTAVQGLLGEVGARTAQLEITSANLDALDGHLKTLRSGLQDADMEKTLTELVGRQTAYQSAMLATSRVMGMTLTDYLR